jgi:hypothetical protein
MPMPLTVSMDDLGTMHAWLERALQAGFIISALQSSINDLEELSRLIEHMDEGVPIAPLGPVFDAEQVHQLFHHCSYPHPDALQKIGAPPPALPDYVTFFDPGYSIARLEVSYEGMFPAIFSTFNSTWRTWDADEDFMHWKDAPCYRQLRMKPLDQSHSQCVLPSGSEELPSARAVVMGMVLCQKLTYRRLFPRRYIRCANVLPNGNHVHVGVFHRTGFEIREFPDDTDMPVGLAPCRSIQRP